MTATITYPCSNCNGSGEIVQKSRCWQGYSGYPGQTSNGLAVPEFFSVELTDGALLLTSGDRDDPWVYAPKEGVVIPEGIIRVTARGHGLSFNLQQVTYPTTSYAEPFANLPTAAWQNPTHAYYFYYSTPPGGAVAVASAVNGGAGGEFHLFPCFTVTVPLPLQTGHATR